MAITESGVIESDLSGGYSIIERFRSGDITAMELRKSSISFRRFLLEQGLTYHNIYRGVHDLYAALEGSPSIIRLGSQYRVDPSDKDLLLFQIEGYLTNLRGTHPRLAERRKMSARQQREVEIAKKLTPSVLTKLDEDKARLLRLRYLSRPRKKAVDMANMLGVSQDTMRQQLRRVLNDALALDPIGNLEQKIGLEKLELLAKGATRLDILANIYANSKFPFHSEAARELAVRFRSESSGIVYVPETRVADRMSFMDIGDAMVGDGLIAQGLVVKNLSQRWNRFGMLPETKRKFRINSAVGGIDRKDLLEYFINNPSRAISYTELLRNVYQGSCNTGVLSRAVGYLRTDIGDDSKNPTHIINIRGFGYRYKPR